ncbi:MAG TPA: hypothetical protein PKZ56_01105 [Candidatus Paceibacterota bacterium]|nr:hypothetical protein [Candidatus Paceibacterota bacterium]
MDSNESLLKKLDNDLTAGRGVSDTNRGILHRDKLKPVAEDWTEPVPEAHHDDLINQKRTVQKSYFKKIFIGSCVFAVISAGLFMFSLFTGRARLSGENVQLTVTSTTFADSGEEVNATVTVTNQNPTAMEFTKLVFKYPLGNTRDPNALKEITRDLGTIGAGETRNEVFPLQLFGEQGNEKDLSAMVEFRLSGSNAIFEKTGGAKLTLRSSIATLVIKAVSTTLSGQQLPIQLTISGNATAPVKDALVIGDFPDGCTFVSSDPEPTLDKNNWYLGDLAVGDQKQINIVLQCVGVTDAEKNIQFSLGSQDSANERKLSSVYTTGSHVLKLSSAFLASTLYINGKEFDKTSSIPQNREIPFEIRWQSNLETPINDARFIVKLSGAAFDPDTVRPGQGYFNTEDDTITWTSNEIEGLKLIQPGQTGSLDFRLISRTGLTTRSTIDAAISVEGVEFGGKQQSLKDALVAKIPVVTDLQIIPRVVYYSGPIKNSGPMPPRAQKETTYTIIWQLANSTNEVSNVVVRTKLPTGIVWKNNIAPSTAANTLSYNTVTREIVWNAGNVPVGKEAKSIAFQLGITPSKTMIGTIPNLTDDTTLEATDTVTNTTITQIKKILNTRINGDTSTVGANGEVKE